MKKLIIILMLIVSANGFAQITLEHTYPNSYDLALVKLSSSGYKYFTYDTSTITILNLNHTVFRVINIPSGGYTGALFQIHYVSEELFNTNPADIEYLLEFSSSGSSVPHVRVYNEAGTPLFSKDSASLYTWATRGVEDDIAYTPSGWKMILNNTYSNFITYIYSLPGSLPCHDCNSGVVTDLVTENNNNNKGSISNYPNPNNGQTTIAYTLPEGITTGDLVFYTIEGKEIKRFKVSSAFDDVIISTADLDAGTYYYQLQTASGFRAGKKMVVIK
jgi:hypothetical protein